LTADNERYAVTEIEPNLEHARRTAVMAHQVVIKLREMGLPQGLDEELASLCTDLGDLWSAQKEFSERFEDMLKSAEDWDAIGDSLVDLRASIDHMAWHLESVRKPLTRVAEFAYNQDKS